MQTVLILHNTFGNKSDELYVSRAAVMDQVKAVSRAMELTGYHYEVVAISDLKELSRLLLSRKESIVFNLVEDFVIDPEQTCYVPSLCKAYGKICTGNSSQTMLFARDKSVTKALLQANGIPCPSGGVFYGSNIEMFQLLPTGKYILKPACSDASEGISSNSVYSIPDECKEARDYAVKLWERFAQDIVVEQYIPDRELNVSILEIKGKPKVLAIAEIDFSAFSPEMQKIVDYDAKWHTDSFAYNNTPRIIPADLSLEVLGNVSDMALASWRALGCRGYIRVDFRMDEKFNPYVIEVNPNPDISPDAGFAAALEYSKIDYDRFVWYLLNGESN